MATVPRILLVDDNPADVELTREAFRENAIEAEFHVVGDGIQAEAFLHKEGPYVDAPTPDVILLDLNLPVMDGRELLEMIKGHPDLRRIPLIVLTTSDRRSDIERCYGLS